ncbi:hypothetical protein Prudu_011631 [Prunus dulcis]|uniref:Uncharacterized protein n=1 Tax=Prunus dulcis TaxID=3755 RepID=A0A4Y1RB02_PRUDU|nr:hypothetical protein Prudu_011631 [Prunus dulcis]
MQQAGPSQGQAAWDYLWGDSAKILAKSLGF